MKTFLLFLLCVLSVGCAFGMDCSDPDSPAGTLALQALNMQDISGYGVYLDGYSSDYPQRFLRQQEAINKYRRWLSTQKDACVVAAYKNWLDFYQRELDEARIEMKEHKYQKEYAAWEAERSKQEKAVANYRREHKFPVPKDAK